VIDVFYLTKEIIKKLKESCHILFLSIFFIIIVGNLRVSYLFGQLLNGSSIIIIILREIKS
jgi:hypothetical protein